MPVITKWAAPGVVSPGFVSEDDVSTAIAASEVVADDPATGRSAADIFGVTCPVNSFMSRRISA